MTAKLKTPRRNGRSCTSTGFVYIAAVTLVAVTLFITAAVIVAVYTNRHPGDSDSQPSLRVSYQLHVNPADSTIMTAETADGDLISVVGEKSSSGVPLTIDEFIVENDNHGSIFVSMNDDGTIKSALSSDGLQIDFIWDEHQTVINTTAVINGSQQVFIKMNLSEPVDTKLMSNSNKRKPLKRSYRYQPRYTNQATKPVKRRRDTQTSDHTDVFVSVESCNGPQPNTAKVYADVLLGYNLDNDTYERKVKYWGAKSSKPGEYKVQVPTTLRNGTNFGSACNNTNLILGKICNVFHKINSVTQFVSGMDADSVFCSFLKSGILTEFPSINNYFALSRFCESIFRPFKSMCNLVGTDKSNNILSCNSLPVVDNGVTIEQNIFFMPTAIFPHGNTIQGTGKVLPIQPGANIVPHQFTISDGGPLRITGFSITPFNPLPKESYVVNVSYNCYSTPMFSAYISVTGTDNFADSQTCYTGPTCTLRVSGSDKSQRDDVKITVKNGQTSVSLMSVVHY
ncbi:uncharacterized protein [Dysidea avara]|uniref:uncharacterized protein n=1 Tax=Dysidea avara TaxID=196820 RepID=UPI0033348F2B